MIQVQLNGFSGNPLQDAVGYNEQNAIKVGWKGKVHADYVAGIETLLMGPSPAGAQYQYNESKGVLTFYRAVRNFQAKYGLSVDGKLGPATWTKVLQVLPQPDPVPPPSPPADGDSDLPQVEEQGFLKRNGTALAVTGGVVALLGTAAYLFRSKIGLGGYEPEEEREHWYNVGEQVLIRALNAPRTLSRREINAVKKCGMPSWPKPQRPTAETKACVGRILVKGDSKKLHPLAGLGEYPENIHQVPERTSCIKLREAFERKVTPLANDDQRELFELGCTVMKKQGSAHPWLSEFYGRAFPK